MSTSFVDARNPVMSALYGLMVQGTKYGVASALSWFYMLLSLITILIHTAYQEVVKMSAYIQRFPITCTICIRDMRTGLQGKEDKIYHR